MNKHFLLLADLSKVNVGDIIWTIKDGFVKITHLVEGDYPIRYSIPFQENDKKLSINGKYDLKKCYTSAFAKNPFAEFTEGQFKEREMFVSSDGVDWKKRTVFHFNEKLKTPYIAFNIIYGDNDNGVCSWRYAKELEEQIQSYTMQQLYDKIGHKFEIIK